MATKKPRLLKFKRNSPLIHNIMLTLIISKVYHYIEKRLLQLRTKLFSTYCANQLKSVGKNFRIHYSSSVLSLSQIEIGDGFYTGKHLRLRAYEGYEGGDIIQP